MCIVNGLQRGQQLQRHLRDLLDRQAPSFPDDRRKRFAGERLHHEPVLVLLEEEVVHPDDAGVRDAGSGPLLWQRARPVRPLLVG
jgi:hypothetical protein